MGQEAESDLAAAPAVTTWATAKVVTSASSSIRRALGARAGRRSLAVTETAVREGVEVGVHRGLQVDGAIATVDFDPSASNPGTTAMSVESIT